jgi:hypothetical protein
MSRVVVDTHVAVWSLVDRSLLSAPATAILVAAGQAGTSRMSVSQWSNWLANLDPVVGSEQGRTRPVLVISDGSLNDILPVVNVITHHCF